MTDSIAEIITTEEAKQHPDNCSNCGSTPKDHVVEDYDMMWHDGNVTCTLCGAFVRRYDAG